MPHPPYALLIHGGAEKRTPGHHRDQHDDAHSQALSRIIALGDDILNKGGTALDAVTAVVIELENCPLYNAGKGAVFTHDGRHTLDAAVMEGASLRAGAIAGASEVKNPILAARAVMEHSKHVLLVGIGADEFAKSQDLEFVNNDYYFTQTRWDEHQRILSKQDSDSHFGTVGAVALDKAGHLAAATSTGGISNKRWGRVGDSPIIGAGTYANDQSCAVSATGYGEFFIRYTVAHDIAARVQYQNLSVEKASQVLLIDTLLPLKAYGGVIVLNRQGDFAMTYTTEVMYRAYTNGSQRFIGIDESMKSI